MSLIHLNEKARDNYFRLMVMHTLCSGTDERCNTYSSPSRGNKPAFAKRFTNSEVSLSLRKVPLFPFSHQIKSLSPSQIPYVHLTETAYAEMLVEQLNYNGGKQ